MASSRYSLRYLLAAFVAVVVSCDGVSAQGSFTENVPLLGSNINSKFGRLQDGDTTRASGKERGRIPLILDWDANYDDALALMYILSNPLFDVKAVSCAGAGFATHHGGPINTQMMLEMFHAGHVPVSYGSPTSLSPISQAPMQWRIELDQFFQDQQLPLPNTPISIYPSDVLIANVLKESSTAVAVAVIGPATNLAMALQKEPELIERISGLFFMGSNHPGKNNVHDYQMQFNGVNGGCSDAAGTNVQAMVTDVTGGLNSIRRGCRGNSLSESGDTEWNIFLDAVAWHVIARVAAQATKPPPIYVIPTGASENMAITMGDFTRGTALLSDNKVIQFLLSLATSFLGAGEAKWWDAQLVIAMADVITGVSLDKSVCAEWLESPGFQVNLQWKHVTMSGMKNPYGSITDVDGRFGPKAYFCSSGNVKNMQDHYWAMLAGQKDPGNIADPSIYLRKLPTFSGRNLTPMLAVGATSLSMIVGWYGGYVCRFWSGSTGYAQLK